jgi:hypothetical protein
VQISLWQNARLLYNLFVRDFTFARSDFTDTPAMLDRLIGTLLFVRPATQRATFPSAEAATHEAKTLQRTESAFNASMVLVGVRCVIQYVILPFVLPVLGIAADWARPLSLAVTVVGIVAIFFTLRRFWQINYRWKWQFLGLSVFAVLFLSIFALTDLAALF